MESIKPMQKSPRLLQPKHISLDKQYNMTSKAVESDKSQMKMEDYMNQDAGFVKDVDNVKVYSGDDNAAPADKRTQSEDTVGGVKMEASISRGDVMQAGVLGATDDIGSLLPVATDSTDFEASLCDAQTFEAPQEQVHRPGLGWIKHEGSH